MQASSQSGAVLINKLKFGKKWLCVADFVRLKRRWRLKGPPIHRIGSSGQKSMGAKTRWWVSVGELWNGMWAMSGAPEMRRRGLEFEQFSPSSCSISKFANRSRLSFSKSFRFFSPREWTRRMALFFSYFLSFFRFFFFSFFSLINYLSILSFTLNAT